MPSLPWYKPHHVLLLCLRSLGMDWPLLAVIHLSGLRQSSPDFDRFHHCRSATSRSALNHPERTDSSEETTISSEETCSSSEAFGLMDRYLGGDLSVIGGYLRDVGGLSGIEDDAFFPCVPAFNREIPGLPTPPVDRLDKPCLPRLAGLTWGIHLPARRAQAPPGAQATVQRPYSRCPRSRAFGSPLS